MKKRIVSPFFIFYFIILFVSQSCSQKETSYDPITEKEVVNEYINDGFKVVNSANNMQGHVSSKELREALMYLKEYRIDTTSIVVKCVPLTSNKIKTRGEGNIGTGTRYGVTIAQEKTLLTHKIYIIYTAINDVYTIENVTYEIDGFRLGNISTSAGNISQSSSTSSEFDTTATYTINVGSYEVKRESVSYRWNIYFHGGSSISFSATEI